MGENLQGRSFIDQTLRRKYTRSRFGIDYNIIIIISINYIYINYNTKFKDKMAMESGGYKQERKGVKKDLHNRTISRDPESDIKVEILRLGES